MNEDIERRLAEAFAAQARSAVGDHAVPPPLELTKSGRSAPRRRRSVTTILAPLAAAAAVTAIAVGIVAHQNTHHDGRAIGPGTTKSPSVVATPVRMKVALANLARVGIGMPVVVNFSSPITDGRALQRATVVTVNGKQVQAAWFFEPSASVRGYPVQGHLRMQSFWPAHAVIAVSAPVAGMSAGGRSTYADNISLQFTTGAATIATVLEAKHQITITEDGKPVGTYRVSLGAPSSPTSAGVKVVMAKGKSICMTGPGYHQCGIKYTQQLTTSGEYLNAAPWNLNNIAHGIDSSNGCTNLADADAARLFGLMEVGDVVKYPDAKGPTMHVGDGLGDWNVAWTVWLRGGIAPTH